MMERRWSIRKLIVMDVALIYDGLGMVRGKTLDISMEGMFIVTGAITLPYNVPIDIVLEMAEGKDRKSHRLPALVVRVAEDGIGTMFRNMEVGALRALQCVLHTGQPERLPSYSIA